MSDSLFEVHQERSEDTRSLYKSLLSIQAAIPVLEADTFNPGSPAPYVSLCKILETINPLCASNGLLVFDRPVVNGDSTRVGNVLEVHHVESGQFLKTAYFMPLMGNHPWDHASIQTYLRRYMRMAVFSIPTAKEDAEPPAPMAYKPNSNVHQKPVAPATQANKEPAVAAPVVEVPAAPAATSEWTAADGKTFSVSPLALKQLERVHLLPTTGIELAIETASKHFNGEDKEALLYAMAIHQQKDGEVVQEVKAANNAEGVMVNLL